jgi:hypothetical protein
VRRLLVCLLFSIVALLAVTPFASANKNTNPTLVTCSNGKTYTAVTKVNSNINSSVLAVGVGPAKTISFTGFAPGTSEVLFSNQTNFPKPANLTCHGTLTQIDPDTGEPFTFDFVVELYAKRT